MVRSSLVIIVLSFVFACGVVWQARRRRTTEGHTFAWLFVCAVVAGLAVWRPAVDAIARSLGIYYPPSALFLGACGGLLWLVYRQSLDLAEHRRRIVRLAREVAVLSVLAAPPQQGTSGGGGPTATP